MNDSRVLSIFLKIYECGVYVDQLRVFVECYYNDYNSLIVEEKLRTELKIVYDRDDML